MIPPSADSVRRAVRPARRGRRAERWLGRGILLLLLGVAATGWVKVLGVGGALGMLGAVLLVGAMAVLALRPLVDLVFGQHRRDAGRGVGPHARGPG